MRPKIMAIKKETIRAANSKPPCLIGSLLKAGVLPFLPPANIELRIPPRKAINIPSSG